MQRSRGLLLLGAAQLFVFLGAIAQNFYWGNKTILLPVQAGETFGPSRTTIIASPVGPYFTGTEGHLLYHATTLWEYGLFYSIGDLTLVDALFLSGLSIYLYRALRQVASGREFSPLRNRAFFYAGLATMVMFTVKLVFNQCAAAIFALQTQHAYSLAYRNSSSLYAVFGVVLLICADFFHRGVLLQQENELTI